MASISVDHGQFSCPVCLDLLKDPVTINCGHSFCMVCINGCWDQDDQRGVYSCPQCRQTFTPRPVLWRNTMLAEVVEKLKETELQAAPPAPCYSGPGDVECDFCTGRKLKAIKSCLTCLAFFCETHLKPHYEVPGLKKHKLVEASSQLQEICSQHSKPIEIYRRTDQSSTCCLCMMEEHRGHDSIQNQLKEVQRKLQQRIQENQKEQKELEQVVKTLKSFQSLCVSSGSEDSPSISVHQPLSFDGVRRSVSELKERLEEFCREEFSKIPPHAAAVQTLSSEPKNREDFLQYYCQLTLDPNTANNSLILSEKNRLLRWTDTDQCYSDRPERFHYWPQVMCKESVSGRCYWEVEWSRCGIVFISVSYKGISRKGESEDCGFGCNYQSWSLQCSPPPSSLYFWHNNIQTEISGPSSSRIGVYVDHSAGTLSFYSVSHTMTLLHTVHTTFTHPLYAGFWVYGFETSVRLCVT